MEIDLFIEDNKIGLFIVLLFLALLVFLRVSGITRRMAEQGPDGGEDPLTEAEFHIAYENYDGAAQAIRKAMVAEPESADLIFKLLEVYSVSNNSDEFLSLARYYKDRFGRSNHWVAIREMGKELMPGDRLFR